MNIKKGTIQFITILILWSLFLLIVSHKQTLHEQEKCAIWNESPCELINK